MKNLIKLLLSTGLYALEQSDNATRKMRERAADRIDDLRDTAQEAYGTATDRVTRAARVMRGEDNRVLGNTLRFAAGIGVGIGIGLLLAPASGEETRSSIVEKVQGFGDKVKKQVSSEDAYATGTNG
jgi:gas vesicle protein